MGMEGQNPPTPRPRVFARADEPMNGETDTQSNQFYAKFKRKDQSFNLVSLVSVSPLFMRRRRKFLTGVVHDTIFQSIKSNQFL